MNLNLIRLNSTILFFVCSYLVNAQNNWDHQRKFLHHLDSLKLHNEKIFWLKSNLNNFPTDSVIIALAKTFISVQNYGEALIQYEKIQTFPAKEMVCYAGVLIATKKFEKLDSLVKSPAYFNKEEKKWLYNYLEVKRGKQTEKFIDSVFGPGSGIGIYYKRYKKAQHKSPVLAAVFSILIPGLGKAYYGKWGDAVPAFFISAVFAAQATESFLKSGSHNPGFWIFSGLYSLFYLGNITGSYLGLKKYKKELQHQLYDEILQHHMAAYPYCWK